MYSMIRTITMRHSTKRRILRLSISPTSLQREGLACHKPKGAPTMDALFKPKRESPVRLPFWKGRRRLRMWSFRGSYANPGSGTQQASSDVVRVTGVEPARLAAREPKSRMSANSIIPAYNDLCDDHYEKSLLQTQQAFLWSGLRGSNSLPPPWQGGALPDELKPHQQR